MSKHAELSCDLPDGSRFVVVGLGGIGCALLEPLAMFLHSLAVKARLVLADGDEFEPQNAERQPFHQLGKKASIKAEEVHVLLGESNLTIVAVDEYLQPANLGHVIKPGDFIFLCVDNHGTRKMVSDYLQSISDSVLISGGNDGISPPRQRGTYGNVQIAVRRDGKNKTVPITHYHPEIANATGKLPHELGCGQLVTTAAQILFTNLAVASAMLNAFFTYACGHLKYQEVKLDILELRMLPQLPVKR